MSQHFLAVHKSVRGINYFLLSWSHMIRRESLYNSKFGSSELDRQTSKFNSPPNFRATWYHVHGRWWQVMLTWHSSLVLLMRIKLTTSTVKPKLLQNWLPVGNTTKLSRYMRYTLLEGMCTLSLYWCNCMCMYISFRLTCIWTHHTHVYLCLLCFRFMISCWVVLLSHILLTFSTSLALLTTLTFSSNL